MSLLEEMNLELNEGREDLLNIADGILAGDDILTTRKKYNQYKQNPSVSASDPGNDPSAIVDAIAKKYGEKYRQASQIWAKENSYGGLKSFLNGNQTSTFEATMDKIIDKNNLDADVGPADHEDEDAEDADVGPADPEDKEEIESTVKESHPLRDETVEILRSLGYNEKQSQKYADEILSKYDPKSEQDIVKIATALTSSGMEKEEKEKALENFKKHKLTGTGSEEENQEIAGIAKQLHKKASQRLKSDSVYRKLIKTMYPDLSLERAQKFLPKEKILDIINYLGNPQAYTVSESIDLNLNYDVNRIVRTLEYIIKN